MADIILASASPRRRELLAQIGVRFTVMPAQGDEVVKETEPSLIVRALSEQKAAEVAARCAAQQTKKDCAEDVAVIGADTIVAKDGEILGKPKDAADACRMLQLLQNAVHAVYTGVTVLYRGRKLQFHSCTQVTMYPMTDAQIAAYVATGEPMDKAGAYAIQGGCAVYIKEIRGEYNNVVGLPVAQLYQECLRFGLDLRS